jgi:hypothetical protein
VPQAAGAKSDQPLRVCPRVLALYLALRHAHLINPRSEQRRHMTERAVSIMGSGVGIGLLAVSVVLDLDR